ncbi:hypothetical protein AYI70_g9834, partial [Smittium culicis]
MGQLNILPKKSWHVYNLENRERVLKDEKAHEQEIEKKKIEKIESEREYRLNLLRARAAAALPPSTQLPPDSNLSPKISSALASDLTSNEPSNKPTNVPIYEKNIIRDPTKELNSSRKFNSPIPNKLNEKPQVSTINKHINFWQEFEDNSKPIHNQNSQYKIDKQTEINNSRLIPHVKLGGNYPSSFPWSRKQNPPPTTINSFPHSSNHSSSFKISSSLADPLDAIKLHRQTVKLLANAHNHQNNSDINSSLKDYASSSHHSSNTRGFFNSLPSNPLTLPLHTSKPSKSSKRRHIDPKSSSKCTSSDDDSDTI